MLGGVDAVLVPKYDPCDTAILGGVDLGLPGRPDACREQSGIRLVTAVSVRHKLVGWDTHRQTRRTAARSGRFRPVVIRELIRPKALVHRSLGQRPRNRMRQPVLAEGHIHPHPVGLPQGIEPCRNL